MLKNVVLSKPVMLSETINLCWKKAIEYDQEMPQSGTSLSLTHNKK